MDSNYLLYCIITGCCKLTISKLLHMERLSIENENEIKRRIKITPVAPGPPDAIENEIISRMQIPQVARLTRGSK
jgi:hypothetical protein